jgi:hypothetical protein
MNYTMGKIKINNKSYELSTDNFIDEVVKKNQIIIGNTFSENMNHVAGWKTRHGGKFKRTANYTIDIYGNIYEHFNPQFYSEFLGIRGIDEHIISILIENEGWLIKDIQNNEYINYVGNIYNRRDTIIEKRWRGQEYWAPYTNPQIESAVLLCKYLCTLFEIPTQVVAHNTKLDEVSEYNGVTYKSNFEKHFTDLSPAWNCGDFKNKLELN